MNEADQVKLATAKKQLEDAKSILEELAGSQQDEFDNLSEAKQTQDAGQEIEENANSLSDIVSNLEDQITAIDELK